MSDAASDDIRQENRENNSIESTRNNILMYIKDEITLQDVIKLILQEDYINKYYIRAKTIETDMINIKYHTDITSKGRLAIEISNVIFKYYN